MRYQFGKFSYDMAHRELRKDGQALHSEPQVIELLGVLIENAGRTVPKEEINSKVWGGRIVSEAALSSRIKTLRQLLDDDGKTQRYIRTIHKRGFRFVGELQTLEEDGDASAPGPSAAAPTSAKRPTVLVLPFSNLSNDPEQDYFCDGITTDIIAHLSRHRWLAVLARNTSFGFKHKPVEVNDLWKQHNIDYVIAGSIRRAGDRIRVNADLIAACAGHTEWSDRLDGQIEDLFDLQDEITERIAARLEPEIGYAERNKVVRTRPANLHAWDCFHLGLHHFFKFTGEDNLEAQRLMQRSQALDPDFGAAYAWWAYAVILGMVYWDTEPSDAMLDQALAACDMALELDHQNASFHMLRARVLLARREYDRAIAANKMAIALNPAFAAAHCGLGDSFAYEKRFDEAIGCFERAIALSPNDPQLWAFYSYGALAMIFKGDFEQALAWTRQAGAIPNCQYWTTAHRVVALAHLGREREAVEAAGELRGLVPHFTLEFARNKLFYLKEQEQVDCYLEGLRMAGLR